MATNNMHNLTTLIKRLEAATSRLEDMAAPGDGDTTKAIGGPSTSGGGIVAGVPPAPPAPGAPPAPAPAAEPLPDSIEEFDRFIAKSVQAYVKQSEELGGPVAEQASKVLRAFEGQRKFLLITTKAKKPDLSSPAYMELLKPLQEEMTAVSDIRENNRPSPLFNQLSTVSESISVLAWVTVDPKPYKHVEESLGSAQYWGNRVTKEYKEKDPNQIKWVQSYYQIFKDLAEYVKETFPHAIVWNPNGVSTQEAAKAVSSTPKGPPAPTAGGPPPPPPPPGPPPVFQIDEKTAAPVAAAAAAGVGIGAVFSELNKGEAVTKGLRKVNANEMTHKNPSLRAGATVPTRSDSQSSVSSVGRGKSPAPGKKPKPESMRTKKPPRKALEGNKWIIENYENESNPVEVEVEISHSILISRCSKTTILVKGKANAISVDNSPRLALVIESLVSSVDVIKSSNFALQVQGALPTILMDQVDGAQIYLSKDSMKTEVFASKCSGINLLIIEGEDDDYKEVALPEQIRSFIGKDGKVVSEIVEHAG